MSEFGNSHQWEWANDVLWHVMNDFAQGHWTEYADTKKQKISRSCGEKKSS